MVPAEGLVKKSGKGITTALTFENAMIKEKKPRKIVIIPIVTESVGYEVLRAIGAHVGDFYSKFNFSTKIIPKISIRPFIEAYNELRGQFLGRVFLYRLATIRVNLKVEAILGVTDVDLYESGLNFIFGLANPYLCSAIISLHRLRPGFYGDDEDERLLKERAIKEAMHELGHVFGLGHCRDTKCVMHFSNSIADTDLKDRNYCGRCEEELEQKLGWAK